MHTIIPLMQFSPVILLLQMYNNNSENKDTLYTIHNLYCRWRSNYEEGES